MPVSNVHWSNNSNYQRIKGPPLATTRATKIECVDGLKHSMPKVFCEYCQSLATVYLRFHVPYDRPWAPRALKVVHVCSVHAVEVVHKEHTNVVNIGRSN